MVWECRRCGLKNKDSSGNCAKCSLERESATSFVIRRKKFCDECSHFHRNKLYCHVFVPALRAFNPEEEEDDEDEDSESDSVLKSTKSGNLKASKSASFAGIQASGKSVPPVEPLETPSFVEEMGYARCNCRYGIPKGNKRFQKPPPPGEYLVGDIVVQTYELVKAEDYADPFDGKQSAVALLQDKLASLNKSASNSAAYLEDRGRGGGRDESGSDRIAAARNDGVTLHTTAAAAAGKASGLARALQWLHPQERVVDTQPFCDLLPTVMQYLQLKQCSQAAAVNRLWYKGVSSFADYIDARNFVPWQVWQAHNGSVDSLVIATSAVNKVFSSGDKRLVASDLTSGEVIGTVIRDSGEIAHILEYEAKVICCSTNGSIRVLNITHNAQNMSVLRTMSTHSKGVNKICLSLPSVGACRMHSLRDHVCHLYSASDDRSIRVWNHESGTEADCIAPKQLRENTFRCLSQTDRHIYAGTSGAAVMVFSKHDVCERDDMHMCNMPEADKTFCLQVTLNLPPSSVSSSAPAIVMEIVCAGYNFSYTHLWAGDSHGQITVWHIPEEGLWFAPAKSWRAHYYEAGSTQPEIQQSQSGPSSSATTSGVKNINSNSTTSQTSAIRAMSSTYRHMISIGDDGFIILTDLITFDEIKRLDVSTYCVEKQLFSEKCHPHIRRKLKSLHVQNELSGTLGRLVAVGTNLGDILIFSLGNYV